MGRGRAGRVRIVGRARHECIFHVSPMFLSNLGRGEGAVGEATLFLCSAAVGGREIGEPLIGPIFLAWDRIRSCHKSRCHGPLSRMQRAINKRIHTVYYSLGAFRTPSGIVAVESALTPARALLNRRLSNLMGGLRAVAGLQRDGGAAGVGQDVNLLGQVIYREGGGNPRGRRQMVRQGPYRLDGWI